MTLKSNINYMYRHHEQLSQKHLNLTVLQSANMKVFPKMVGYIYYNRMDASKTRSNIFLANQILPKGCTTDVPVDKNMFTVTVSVKSCG